jgi:hypothetical protein
MRVGSDEGGWEAYHYTRCGGASDTLVHRHSGNGHNNVGENSGPDPSQTGAQSDHGAGDAAKPMGGWLLHDGREKQTVPRRSGKGGRRSQSSRCRGPAELQAVL